MVQHVGNRDISDHRPIWRRYNKSNSGPKPFKIFKILVSQILLKRRGMLAYQQVATIRF